MTDHFYQWPSTFGVLYGGQLYIVIPSKTRIYESIFRWCWSWWIKWARLAASPRWTWSNGMVNVKVYRTTIYHWFQEHSAQNCWNWSNQTNFTWSNSPCSYQYKNSHEYDNTGISSRSFKSGRCVKTQGKGFKDERSHQWKLTSKGLKYGSHFKTESIDIFGPSTFWDRLIKSQDRPL